MQRGKADAKECRKVFKRHGGAVKFDQGLIENIEAGGLKIRGRHGKPPFDACVISMMASLFQFSWRFGISPGVPRGRSGPRTLPFVLYAYSLFNMRIADRLKHLGSPGFKRVTFCHGNIAAHPGCCQPSIFPPIRVNLQ